MSSDTPIEDYLDELLRRTHADPRTTRQLLDEANDHLFTTASELQGNGVTRIDAETEAVRRLGPVTGLARGSWRRSFGAMILETLRAATLLGGWGLVAVGLSGVLAALMTTIAGHSFVGAATVLGTDGHTITETANDAVSLRIFAGLVGLLVLTGHAVLRRRPPRRPTVLPRGLIDTLGAAAFAAATAVLAGASLAQAMTSGATHGVGFFLSGALIALAAAIAFCTRATQALLPNR